MVQPLEHSFQTARAPTQERYQVYTDLNALNDLKVEARKDQKAALKPVAEQFEALFIDEILKQARKVKFDDGWLDGQQSEFFKDMYDKQLAQSLSAKGSLGLADMMVEQLAPKYPVMTKSEFDEYQQKKLQNQGAGVEEGANTTQNAAPLTQDQLAVRAKLAPKNDRD